MATEREVTGWITINGKHIPLYDGESPQDAYNRYVKHNGDKKSKDIESAKKQAQEANKQNTKEEQSKANKTDAPTFHKAITEAKESNDETDRWRVDIHEVDDYKNDKLFTSKGGSTVAVTSDGDIISVCRHAGDRECRGSDLLDVAVKNGGVKLDSFAGNHAFYSRNGFEAISYTPFDKQYAPPGWTEGRDKEEPVIFYMYVGKGNVTTSNLDAFLSKTQPFTGDDGYDKAKNFRNDKIK